MSLESIRRRSSGKLSKFLFTWLVVGLYRLASAQTYDTNGVFVQTFVGFGFSGWFEGVGAQTIFNNSLSVVADSQSSSSLKKSLEG